MTTELESQTSMASTTTFPRSPRPAVTLKFEDVVYKIKIKCKKTTESSSSSWGGIDKTILCGISGVVYSGETLAMLGPSGSGKTTLLTALAGRLAGDLTGTITYNDKPFVSAMMGRRNMGFVMQDDFLYPHLTVNETLYYTALLRLPMSLSRQEKAARAEAVMTELGLSSCRDTIIGDHVNRGVSGGERKRVSIGQELLVDPSLILLDEPTSGLDSTTAQRIVTLFKELADAGRTVVMTIHQPSSRLYYLFHKVLLISDGRPMYFGEGPDALDYFSRLGYSPSVFMNPSDFLLDLSNGLVSSDDVQRMMSVKKGLLVAYEEKIKPRLGEELLKKNKAINVEVVVVGGGGGGESSAAGEEFQFLQWWEQFRVLLERDVKERRHDAFSVLKVCQILVTSFLSGILWWRSQGHIQDQVGFFFFAVGFWEFFAMYNAVFTFPHERKMLTKERSSGMYRLSSYFAAKMVGDLPMELVLPSVFVTIVYWMSGMKASAGSFLMTLLVFLLNVLVSSGLGLTLGALVMDSKKATTLAAVMMLLFMLVGGFYIQKVPSSLAWLKYTSICYHAFKLSVGAQFSEIDRYDCGGGGGVCFVKDVPSVAAIGLEGTWCSVVALVGMLVFYRTVAYWALSRIGSRFTKRTGLD